MWRRSGTSEELRLFWDSLLAELFDKFLDVLGHLGRVLDLAEMFSDILDVLGDLARIF